MSPGKVLPRNRNFSISPAPKIRRQFTHLSIITMKWIWTFHVLTPHCVCWPICAFSRHRAVVEKESTPFINLWDNVFFLRYLSVIWSYVFMYNCGILFYSEIYMKLCPTQTFFKSDVQLSMSSLHSFNFTSNSSSSTDCQYVWENTPDDILGGILIATRE